MSEFKRGDRVRLTDRLYAFPYTAGTECEYIAPSTHEGNHVVVLPNGIAFIIPEERFSRILTDEEIAELVAKEWAQSSLAAVDVILEAFRLRDERDGK